MSVGPCEGAYATDGTYSCSDGVVDEDCFTTCSNDYQCNDGYECNTPYCEEILLPNGSACTGDAQCDSGHCGDGFCCPDGECCAAVGDCDDSLCNDRACDGNFQCDYDTIWCGWEDAADGDTCTGDNLCDGYGNCVVVGACTGPYAHDGSYSCAESDVLEVCNDMCYNFTDCNDGYDCIGGECTSATGPNGADCTEDTDCESGHCEGGYCCPSGN